MGRISEQQNTFSGGEFSQLMLGRQDIDKYKSALQTCFNAMLLIQGGWTRRPGTARLLQTRSNGGNKSYLFPFTYSTTQKYMLEFGDQYIRFYSGHGLVTQIPQAITAATQANPCVVTYSGSDTYANGDRVYISEVLGMTQLNNREFKVANVNTGANTFELNDQDDNAIDSTGYDAYTSAGTVAEILNLASPYAVADISTLRAFQSADVLYLLHPSYAPLKLIRTGSLSWSLVTIAFIDGPYLSVNATTTTLTPAAATGTNITLTASSTTGINGGSGFLATDVGRLIRLKTGSTWGYCTVTAFTDSTHVKITINKTLTNTTAKVSWRLGLYSATTGYPAAGTFFEDRLCLGGVPTVPQRFDGSKTGNYENFSPTALSGVVADDNAISFTLNSADVNPIRWMVNNIKALLIGTGGSEWQVKASALSQALTPTNVSAKRMSSYGSDNVMPVEAGTDVLYMQKAGRKLRQMAYVFQDDTFKSPDMTLLAEHISEPSIIKIVIQYQPQPVIWCLRSDGVLAAMSYDRDQNITGWHRHILGGVSDVDGNPPIIEDIAVQIAPDGSRDELWLIVQRYVNGQTVRSVEFMTKLWETTDDQTTAFYADYGWTQIENSNIVTGLFWAEGETFGIIADGAAHPAKTVTNGKVTLDYVADVVTLGYHYNSDGADMPDASPSVDGSGQSKMKRIGRIGFWIIDTLGLKYGPNEDTLTELIIRLWGANYGEPTALASGVVRERLESDFDRLGNVFWRANGCFPATVLSLMTQSTVSDDS